MTLPKMTRIQQTFEAPVLTDLPAAIHTELARINAAAIIKSGETVAITAGSRGVANVATAVKATADYLKTLGAHPFVVEAVKIQIPVSVRVKARGNDFGLASDQIGQLLGRVRVLGIK